MTLPNQFFIIAGPCVVEGREAVLEEAAVIKRMADDAGLPLVFKASYRKANRSRLDSFTGIGDLEGLRILDEVRRSLQVPVITDIHSADEAARAAEFVDMLQIPAFLCRQTDLLLAAAATGLPVNIKKGQFLSPEAMRFAVQKVREAGCHEPLVTDRGTMFGYHDLVVDMRSIPVMARECGCPVVLDVTHSLQKPNAAGGVTGGDPSMISTLARAGVAAGADALFLETHPDPSRALSDGANMLPLDRLPQLLREVTVMRRAYEQLA